MLFLAVAGALLVPQSSGQDFARVVSFAHTAAPLKRVLPKLGQASGLTLTVSTQLENEVLLIEFDKKPISEALKNIATVTHAEWVRNGNSIELQRPSERQEELARRSFQTRFEVLRRSLEQQLKRIGSPIDEARAEEMVKEAARFETLDDEAQSIAYYSNATLLPLEDRFALGLASLLDLEWLSSLAPGQNVVLVSNPQYPELPLPDGVERLIQQFVAEKRALSVAAGRHAYVGEPSETFYPWILFAEPLVTDDLECRLTIEPGQSDVDFDLELNFTRGWALSSLKLEIDVDPQGEALPAFARAPSQWEDVPLSDLSRLEHEMRLSFLQRRGVEVSAEAKSQAMGPTEHDPLGFLISDVIRHLAAKDGVALCAVLTDAAEEHAIDDSVGINRESPNDFHQCYLSTTGVRVTEVEGWRLIAPKDPVACEASRMPREIAEQKIKFSIEGGASLRQLAELSAAQPPLAYDWVYIGAWMTGQGARFVGESWTYDDPEFDGLRFLARLEDAQFNRLLMDGFLSLSDLGSEQRETLLQLVLRHGRYLYLDGKSIDEGPPNYRRLLAANPDQVKLELVARETWLIDQLYPAGLFSPADIDLVARRLNLPNPAARARAITYRAAKTAEYDLRIRFPDGAQTLVTGIWLPVRMPEKYVAVSELPSELLQLIEIERKKLSSQPP